MTTKPRPVGEIIEELQFLTSAQLEEITKEVRARARAREDVLAIRDFLADTVEKTPRRTKNEPAATFQARLEAHREKAPYFSLAEVESLALEAARRGLQLELVERRRNPEEDDS